MNARPEFTEGTAAGEASASVLAARARAGTAPIYYRLPDTPEGHHIKEYASGLRQLVRFVGVEEQVVKYVLG
ncbi:MULTISPECIES: hypothetical protein [unclassified Cupriavidus]|uniref:hypothetical protein n=1 Tax=unclassified Cupriavidus TaxID=2640874 RepID=UPI0010F95720|nr:MULTISPECIES: hypothetical protein [unclassified Cupriavidus]MWL90631.1 hypothetical protein [Cupriavidus sp. SW-Y-13]